MATVFTKTFEYGTIRLDYAESGSNINFSLIATLTSIPNTLWTDFAVKTGSTTKVYRYGNGSINLTSAVSAAGTPTTIASWSIAAADSFVWELQQGSQGSNPAVIRYVSSSTSYVHALSGGASSGTETVDSGSGAFIYLANEGWVRVDPYIYTTTEGWIRSDAWISSGSEWYRF